MHKAPTVDYPVGRSRFQSGALLALWLGVAAVDAWWFVQADRLDWRHGLGFAASCACAGVALGLWRRTPEGRLHWDGQSWWWESGGVRASGVVVPRLDFQSVLLIGFRAHSGVRHWFWLERGSAPARWSALRRAVHAPVKAEAGDGPDVGVPDSDRGGGAARS